MRILFDELSVKLIEPHYRLIDCGNNEWRFHESAEMQAATAEFDYINEGSFSRPRATDLYRFLKKHPDHIDVLHHYSCCLNSQGKYIEALAFSQTAVAIGMRAFPKQFAVGQDRLPTGFDANRPFLRAVHGLMLCQRSVGLIDDAIATGEMCLALDREDRMGASESLVVYLVESGRDKTALALFENPNYKDKFSDVEYLHAVALIRLGRDEEARTVLRSCLHYYPQVARFILNRNLPQPANEDRLGGVVSGSELEGWSHARNFGSLWRSNRAALKILREESRPYAAQSWKRYANQSKSES